LRIRHLLTGGNGPGAGWPLITVMVDRGGRRTRYYARRCPGRPGARDRREQRERGLGWCRRCQNWLPLELLDKNRLCLEHRREEGREYYAANAEKVRRLKCLRKRGVERLSREDQDFLTSQFGGQCVYCGKRATGWDHIRPVVRGGQTEQGNIVPACQRCNSSKKARSVFAFVRGGPESVILDLLDVMSLAPEVHL